MSNSIEAGVKTIIELRDADSSSKLPYLCSVHGIEYFHYPVDNQAGCIRARQGHSVQVDARRMSENGIKFFLSNNGVWLTDYVDAKYVEPNQ